MKRLDAIFDIWYGVNLELVNCEQTENGMPFVSRQSVNNGISGFVKPLDIEPNPAHSLSIAGSGSVLSTFYHDYEYYSGRDVYIAKPKNNLTKEQMLYYAYVIEDNRYRYNYGRQANKTMKNILVPDIDELPDYVNKMSVSDYQFEEEPIIKRKIELNTESWKWFELQDKDLFEIYTSSDKNFLESKDGTVPYISSTQFNNGVSSYVQSDNFQNENTITVARNGSVGSAFYHSYNYCASPDDIRIFNPKFKLNKYIGIFLCALIEKDKYRFAYGRKFGTKRMKIAQIKLPITKDGRPDWQFMEDYIKSLPYSNSI
jgi:hypothetical protein